MLLPIRTDAHGTQFQEEIFILQRLPYMTGAGKAHPLAIAADALLIEHCQVHLVQNQHILRLYRCITHHSLILLLGAAIVALTVTSVGAERVAVHIHRFIGALGTGDIDDHDVIAVDRVVFMNQGVILEQGSPKEVFGNPKEPRTREFLSRYLEDKMA